MSGRRTHSGRRWIHRLIGLLVLASLCASFIPLPISTTSLPEKDQSEPFPCQNRPCGCQSAEQCWKQCCCFTNAEKLVWAQENGVTPPQFVVEAAKAESAAKVAIVQTSDRKPCRHCTKSPSRDHANASPRSPRLSECCESPDCVHRDQDDHKENSVKESTRFVIGIEMMKCRGHGVSWNSLPWAVIPVAHTPDFWVEPASWESPRSDFAASCIAEPPEPPPRLV
jgi:hypothetical protein